MNMLDEKDLQAIAQLIDARISDTESHLTSRIDKLDSRIDKLDARVDKLDSRIDKLDARVDKLDSRIDKLDARVDKLDAKIDDTESRVLAYIEADILPRFDLLAEGHQLLRETLAPKDRVEALEDEVSFMKQVIKSMSRDIEALKKAQ